MKFSRVSFAVLVALGLTTPAQGQSASEFCPTSIDDNCLAAVVDHVISEQTNAANRRKLALDYSALLFSQAPEHAAQLANAYTKDADQRSLRRLAKKFAEAGQTAGASRLIKAAADTRANDPNPAVKVLDMLLIAKAAAEVGDLALTRQIHNSIIPFLPGELTGHVPLSEERELTLLMALYGWPEDAYPILETVYPKLKSIPQDSWNYGFTLTNLLLVVVLTGHESLYQQIETDISIFLAGTDPKVRNQAQKAHVSALTKAGKVKDAQRMAAAYGLEFEATIRGIPHFFLGHESSYFPGIPKDTLRRYELVLAAIESPALKAEFLAELASSMLKNKQFEGMDTLLNRIEDPSVRSELVLQLMIYHARERKDANVAADLYFSELPRLVSKFPNLSGTFLKQYPLSLTARGLLEMGDHERGGQLADVVLRLWSSDQSGRRSVDRLLVGALAGAGDERRVNMWYTASNDPSHQLDVLVTSLRAQAKAGRFPNMEGAKERLGGLLSRISDAKRQAPNYWPKDRPYPTLRDEANAKVSALERDIVAALAEHDRLSEAVDAFTALPRTDFYPWRAQLAVADASARAGKIDQSIDAKRMTLNALLNGSIAPQQMPYVIHAMHP